MKRKYKRPLFKLDLIDIEDAITAHSANIRVIGSDVSDAPLIEDFENENNGKLFDL